MRSRPGGLLIAALALLTAAPARAFCRTTTCQPGDAAAPCSTDSNGCLVGGEPLFWAGACVSYSVQRDGSPLRGISAKDAELAVGAGFSSWMGAACAGGAGPSIGVVSRGLVSCDRQEYSSNHGNANVWMFRDDDWPYDDTGATLALTTVTYNRRTGEIYDADVEVNSHDNEITLGDGRIAFDFLSIATHEAGHFLGLSHNPRDPDATMTPGYFQGTVALRTLESDDVAGICASYPPGRSAHAVQPSTSSSPAQTVE